MRMMHNFEKGFMGHQQDPDRGEIEARLRQAIFKVKLVSDEQKIVMFGKFKDCMDVFALPQVSCRISDSNRSAAC